MSKTVSSTAESSRTGRSTPYTYFPTSPPTTCMELIHVNLNVSDMDKAIQFYTEELGFTETWGFEEGSTVHRYVADGNGVELQLSETDGRTEFDHGDAWDHLAVQVDDVDEAVEDIDHYGIEEEPGDQPAAGARTAFILGPDGYTIELVESLDE